MSRFLSSAYGPPWEGIQGTGTTATGIDLRPARQIYIVAVDPTVIPLHSKLTAWPNPFGISAVFRAEDTGSAIKGKRIDFYDWRGRKFQNAWGMKYVDVDIVGAHATPTKPTPVSGGPGALPARPEMGNPPPNGVSTAYDYSHVIRSSRVNVQRSAAYLRDAGIAIRRLQR